MGAPVTPSHLSDPLLDLLEWSPIPVWQCLSYIMNFKVRHSIEDVVSKSTEWKQLIASVNLLTTNAIIIHSLVQVWSSFSQGHTTVVLSIR